MARAKVSKPDHISTQVRVAFSMLLINSGLYFFVNVSTKKG